MGFSSKIFTQRSTGPGTNFLNGRTGLPALSTIYGNYTMGASAIAPSIKLLPSTSQNLTCIIIAEQFAQILYNGSPTFVANQNGIYSFANGDNTFPYKIYNSSTEGFNTIDYYLSATGQACASGQQDGCVFWQLSTTCLSGTSAGTVIPVTVTNDLISFDGVTSYPYISGHTSVWCINSPFPSSDPVYYCQDEFSRMQQYNG